MDQNADLDFEEQHWIAIENVHQIESDDLWDSVFALRKLASKRTLDRALDWSKQQRLSIDRSVSRFWLNSGPMEKLFTRNQPK